jgi:diguanylate cyclase (GGDEF)-like protein
MTPTQGSVKSWFNLDDVDLLEQRIHSLKSNMVIGTWLVLALTAIVSFMVADRMPLSVLVIGGVGVAVAAILRVLMLKHGVQTRKRTQLVRTEVGVAVTALAIFTYIACLIGTGPALSAEVQVGLAGIGVLMPLAALRTIGSSRLTIVAATIPMFIGAWFALIRLQSDYKLALIFGFIAASLVVLEHVWRELTGATRMEQSRNRERSLQSQQLALFSTSQMGIAQTVGTDVRRANGRFRQWFGEGLGDTLFGDIAGTIGMAPERLTRLITRAESRIDGHESRTVHLQLNGPTPRHFSVQVRRFDPKKADRGLLWTVSDQTSDWLRQQADERAATRDPLTGALNRRALHKKLSTMLTRDLRRQPFAVLCVDINRFGELNVANGEGFGDQILCIVTRRLQRMLREQDTIARTGGNEFVLVLDNVNGMDRATQIAEKVMETLSAPIVLTSMTCSIAAAVGIAVAPMHGRRTDEVLGRARASMFAIKRTMVQVQAGRIGRRAP